MHLLFWISGSLVAMGWAIPVVQAMLNLHRVADLTEPKWDPPAITPMPSITIVVPARNEAADLEPAIRSLLRLDYPDFQIIAINDRSTDATGELLERISDSSESKGRLRVIHVHQLPHGWLGKTHAMWLGAQQGTGEWILFTDADCVFHPDAIRRALYYVQVTTADHLVLFPTALVETWGERMMISFTQVTAGLALRAWKVPDPNAREFIGVGAFNLISRAAYIQIGTFTSLRMAVIDDLQLGQAVKEARLRQDVVFGPNLVSLRWAQGAFGVVRNLEKNLFAFFGFRMVLVILACFAVLFSCVWPFVGLVFAPGWSRAAFALAVAMIVTQHFLTERVSRISPVAVFTFPLGAVIFVFSILRSAFVTLRDGAITWRGTKYSLEELRRHTKPFFTREQTRKIIN
jgi:cellulose synthase/poly-beta-1,6-N-acetylglucosamine synthase-like glycosyltransferase